MSWWRSSTLRLAVLAAILVWAPGALLLSLLQEELEAAFFEVHLERLAEEFEEALWTTRELLDGGGEEEAEGEEDGEEDEDEEENEWEDLAFEDWEIDTPIMAMVFEDFEITEELSQCARLTGPFGEIENANFEEVEEWVEIEPGVGLIRARVVEWLAEEFEGEELWCLARRVELSDGGELLYGHPVGDAWERVRHGARWRDLFLFLGLPLALGLGVLQWRPAWRFLSTLYDVAGRQEEGDARARLHAVAWSGDARHAAAAVDRMLDRLEQQAHSLSRVSDSIAHDLRTPLARLQGQLDLLKQSSDPRGELIEAIQDEADQLLATFNALLRIAQIESGEKKDGFRPFDFAEVVANVAELYGPVFAENGIELRCRLPRGRLERVGDADLWTQALSNLVENALKYTSRNGEVGLEVREVEGRTRLVLRDSGPGIPEAERDNVFRRFYRLERHRGARGSGLGLTLVAAVCELHSAEIELRGAAIGPLGERGLVVEITF